MMYLVVKISAAILVWIVFLITYRIMVTITLDVLKDKMPDFLDMYLKKKTQFIHDLASVGRSVSGLN